MNIKTKIFLFIVPVIFLFIIYKLEYLLKEYDLERKLAILVTTKSKLNGKTAGYFRFQYRQLQ